jgi:hypothetical protein
VHTEVTGAARSSTYLRLTAYRQCPESGRKHIWRVEVRGDDGGADPERQSALMVSISADLIETDAAGPRIAPSAGRERSSAGT